VASRLHYIAATESWLSCSHPPPGFHGFNEPWVALSVLPRLPSLRKSIRGSIAAIWLCAEKHTWLVPVSGLVPLSLAFGSGPSGRKIWY